MKNHFDRDMLQDVFRNYFGEVSSFACTNIFLGASGKYLNNAGHNHPSCPSRWLILSYAWSLSNSTADHSPDAAAMSPTPNHNP